MGNSWSDCVGDEGELYAIYCDARAGLKYGLKHGWNLRKLAKNLEARLAGLSAARCSQRRWDAAAQEIDKLVSETEG